MCKNVDTPMVFWAENIWTVSEYLFQNSFEAEKQQNILWGDALPVYYYLMCFTEKKLKCNDQNRLDVGERGKNI